DGANQARELFAAASDEAKRAKAAAAAKPKPVVQPPQPQPQITLAPAKPIIVPKLEPAAPSPAPVPVESEASVEARIREQQEHAKAIMNKTKPATVVAEAPRMNPIEPAYRAYARGDLATSEQLLNALLSQKPTAEAFLLRGCTRYTRAILSRTPAPLLANASADFREAVKLNRAAHLDKSSFSPKLVAFFEQARTGR
ncbi:MAG TPA: hypothetical protein VF219_20800, partial [Vicinamibacterales bacterium]